MGTSLVECTRRVTNREFNTWQEYKRQKWNSPGLTEWYLMQLAAEVRRSFVKNPKQVKIEGFQLQFNFTSKGKHDTTTNPQEGLTAEQINSMMAQMWFTRLGQKPPEEFIPE